MVRKWSIKKTTWSFDNSCTLSINIWVSEDDIGLWFLATCRDCSINLALGTWFNTLHLLIQDKEDGINETVDTHGELLMAFSGFY